MTTIYKGKPLEVGENIPGTSLIFVGTILPRRGEFKCICGRTVAYNISDIEHGSRKSCGRGCHKNIQNINERNT